MSRPLKRLSGFLARTAVLYAAGFAAWPYLHDSYLSFLRAMGEACLGRFGPDGRVAFPAQLNDQGLEGMALFNTRSKAAVGRTVPWKTLAYVPLITVAALTLATPLGWRRRVASFVLGVAAVHVWVLLQLTVMLYVAYAEPRALAQFDFRTWFSTAVLFVDGSLIRVLDWHAVPILIWILVTFRHGDLRRLMDLPDEPSTNALGAAGATHGGRGAAHALEGGRGGRNRHTRAKRRAKSQSRPTAT